jgi:hypothetical protein
VGGLIIEAYVGETLGVAEAITALEQVEQRPSARRSSASSPTSNATRSSPGARSRGC